MQQIFTKSGNYNFYMETLRRNCFKRLGFFLESIGLRNLATLSPSMVFDSKMYADARPNRPFYSDCGKELNLDYILNEIKIKMGYCIKDVNEYFYKVNPGQNDNKLCS